MGDVRPPRPTAGFDGTAHDLTHDPGFPGARDAAETALRQESPQRVAVFQVIAFLDRRGAEHADVTDTVTGLGCLERFPAAFAGLFTAGIRQTLAAGVLKDPEDFINTFGDEEVIAGVLLHGAEGAQMIKQLVERRPGSVGIQQDGGLALQVPVERLVSDKHRDRLEQILQGRARREHEGVGLNDFFLDV